MKNMTVVVGSRTETIPQAWLMGATTMGVRRGLTYKAATLAAINQWIEQGDMQAELAAERAAA